eukprot:UN13337
MCVIYPGVHIILVIAP